MLRTFDDMPESIDAMSRGLSFKFQVSSYEKEDGYPLNKESGL